MGLEKLHVFKTWIAIREGVSHVLLVCGVNIDVEFHISGRQRLEIIDKLEVST